MEHLTPRFSSKTLGVLIVSIGIFACSTAAAEADSNVAFGFGMHATVHMSSGIDDNSAAGVGAQARLKLARIVSLRVDYDISRREQAEDRTQTPTTLAQLVPYPDLRMALGFSPIPNTYFSPVFSLGAGLNTGTWDEPVFLAGAGAEVTFLDHWVLAGNFQIFYAMPKRYIEFVQWSDAMGQDVRLKEILTPQTYQVVLELTYYL